MMPARREAYLSGLFGALGVATTALALFLLYYFLSAAASVSTPFVAGLSVALLCDPLVRKFQKHIRAFRGQRTPAVILVFVLFILSVTAIGVLLTTSAQSQYAALDTWIQENGVSKLQNQINLWLKEHRKIGSFELPKSVNEFADKYSKQATDTLKQSVPKLLTAVIGSLGGLLNIVLTPLVAFFILMDLGQLRRRLVFLLPTNLRRHFVSTSSDVGEVFSSYLRGMMQVSLTYMAVSSILFAIFSLIFAPKMVGSSLLIGLVSGVLYSVPYVGLAGAMATAVIVALVNGAGVSMIIVSLGILALLNGVFDNVVTPKIVGQGVGIHPIVAMFALLIGANLFGLWGMLLAYPMAGSIQVVLFRLFPKLAQPTPADSVETTTEPEAPVEASH